MNYCDLYKHLQVNTLMLYLQQVLVDYGHLWPLSQVILPYSHSLPNVTSIDVGRHRLLYKCTIELLLHNHDLYIIAHTILGMTVNIVSAFLLCSDPTVRLSMMTV